MLGELLTHYTIRVALICLVARLACELPFVPLSRSSLWICWIWTLGGVAFTAHVLFAFHFYHQWSPTDALEVTARRTEEMLGVRFGAGIYFSYLFWILWCADVAWIWLAPQSYGRRSRTVVAMLFGYMAFIAFNGAVVFEDKITRWVGIPVTVALISWTVWNWRALIQSAAQNNRLNP